MGFATNRFPEAEMWARIVAEDLGLRHVQLVADLLNPWWPEYVLEAELERIQRATQRYGLQIDTLMSSTLTRYNFFLYPYAELRNAYVDWYCKFGQLAARLGAKGIGSHFSTFTVHDYADPTRREARLSEAVRLWQEISHIARDAGLEYLYIETMSIPRELADTIAGAKEILARINEHSALPFYFCLDVGHAPHPSERDPYPWLEQLGKDSRICHLQQTELNHSRHWPFTEPYNERGIVDPQRTLEALTASGAEEIVLAFEISHRERAEDDPLVIPELAASARYWREFLPVDGEWQPQKARA